MGWVADFINQASYGQTTLVTTFKEVTLTDKTSGDASHGGYNNDEYESLRTHVLNNVTGVTPSTFDFDIVRYGGGPSGPSGDGGGFAKVGEKGNWLKTDDVFVAAHELGHNLGVQTPFVSQFGRIGWRPDRHLVVAGNVPARCPAFHFSANSFGVR
jgi:hypothetical protein